MENGPFEDVFPIENGDVFLHLLFSNVKFPMHLEDSSYGLALPVLWKLWDRLSGVFWHQRWRFVVKKKFQKLEMLSL